MPPKATTAGLRQTATPDATGCFAQPSPGIDEYVAPTLESMSTRQKLATGAQRALLTQTRDAHCIGNTGAAQFNARSSLLATEVAACLGFLQMLTEYPPSCAFLGFA